MEECRPDPDPSTNRGVCLKKSSDPAAKKQLDELTKKGGGGVGGITFGVKEGEACTKGITRCETPLYCDGVCKKTWNLRSKVSGHRIPPPPGDPNCRDSLDSNEIDESKTKCNEVEELCNVIIYVQLMKEQCPKTCGYCDDPSLTLIDYDHEKSYEKETGEEEESYEDEESEENEKR
uniref:ShKT domain-containing protein n=1 Tax=Meloidogyne hapla TaxID=6305 RepID=A0A1I8BHZ5_MELHA